MLTAPLSALSACAFLAAPAAAHFQVLHAGPANIGGGRALDFTLAFAHPFAGDPVMDMGQPQAFYLVRQAGEQEAQRVDLAEYLRPATFRGLQTEAAAFTARLPASLTRGLGDHVFVLEPAPYYEAEEDTYIQQFTKTVLNVGGLPGNWAEPVGLPAEIVPLDRPYGVWAGGIFRGMVMSEGEPVPFAEVEVEYMNHPLDPDGLGWEAGARKLPEHAVMETISARADATGMIAVALPWAGWWGIGALGVGPETEHEGKPLSQDAVLWVEALSQPE